MGTEASSVSAYTLWPSVRLRTRSSTEGPLGFVPKPYRCSGEPQEWQESLFAGTTRLCDSNAGDRYDTTVEGCESAQFTEAH